MKPGPKPKPMDYDTLTRLCEIHCTLSECASVMGVSDDYIQDSLKRDHNLSFEQFYEKNKGKGRAALRRKMFEVAMEGNVTMLIWLSKQYLKFTEIVEHREIPQDKEKDVEELKNHYIETFGNKQINH